MGHIPPTGVSVKGRVVPSTQLFSSVATSIDYRQQQQATTAAAERKNSSSKKQQQQNKKKAKQRN